MQAPDDKQEDQGIDIEDIVSLDSVREVFNDLLKQGDMNPTKLYALFDGMRKRMTEHNRSQEGYIPKEYIGFEVGITAYGHILDNGGTRAEALEFSRNVHDLTVEYMEAAKNRQYFYTRKTVEAFNDHPSQKTMLENGAMDKRALSQPQSINSQLGRLAKSKELSDTLETLKETDIRQQSEIETISGKLTVSETYIKELRELTGIKELSHKEIAKLLKDKGLKQKFVAEFLGRDVRTIRRWWNDI
jgi:DNA-binding transcriptional regulator YiaG